MKYYYSSDPYAEATPQQSASREYHYGPLSLLFPAVFLLASLAFLVPGISGLLQGNIAQSFNLAYIGLFTLIIFVICAVTAFQSITCDEERITFRHWLGFRPQLSWREVEYLRIERTRGTFGHLKGRAITIVFTLGSPFGPRDASTLMKTIIARASLQFTRADWARVHYERLDRAS